MKENFIKMCECSDLIVMGGVIIKYCKSINSLYYRINGEEIYKDLSDIPNENITYQDNFYVVKLNNCSYKFNFYQEINI
jgi:hypothetical protein